MVCLKLFLLFLLLQCTNGAKILCVFPFPSISHQIVFQALWKDLSLRGHELTVITPNPLNDPKLNVTEIDVSVGYQIAPKTDFTIFLYGNVFQRLLFMFDYGMEIIEKQLEHVNVQNFIKNDNLSFDLVIVQQSFLYNIVNLGFVGKVKAPFIGISSLGVFLHSHDAVGNPTHPAISPDMMLNFSGELNFYERIKSFLFNFWYRILYHWYTLPKADRVARKYFGDDIPYLGDIERNISLLMLNVNPFLYTTRPNVPSIIEINQMHIRKKKPLPQELKDYLDSSKRGVIYFSLGSNVKSTLLNPNLRQTIIEALGELPYNVLWKFEADYLPGQPKNIMIKKWLPQQDILAHKNVKVFVTQGGLQSIEEAISHGVPMVGMPFITDQPSNIKKIVELEMGISVDYQTLTKDQLKKAIVEVITNKKYKKNIKKSYTILTDQPLKGVEKAIWWIEYVIRHKGANHLRSPAADMSFFQYFMLDVILFLLSCAFILFYCVVKILHLRRKFTTVLRKIKEN